MTSAEGRQVESAGFVKRGSQDRGAEESRDQAENGASSDQAAGLRDDQAQYIRTLRAERHAHADFVGSLDDEERHHAVNADRGEDKCDAGKNREEHDREPAGRDRVGDDLLESADMGDGQGGIDCLDGAADRAR